MTTLCATVEDLSVAKRRGLDRRGGHCADLLKLDVGDEQFEPKIKVLKEEVEHHVGEEENDLFPKVKKLLSADDLDALEQEMVAEQDELEEEGNPRESIPGQTGEAAHL